MELECIKYKEMMKAEEAVCKHPGDYCKYRTSCLIQFMSSENKNRKKQQEQSSGFSPDTTNSKAQ